jgi:MFS family permease
LPKRVALAAIYNLQALLCILVPVTLGTDLITVLMLIFAVSLLGQVSGPTESAVVPLVASQEQLASAASLVSLASNIGTAFGTAILAPVLVRLFDEQAVFYVSGLLLFLAATRVFDLATPQRIRRMDWRRPNVNVRVTLRWLAHERAVATMIVVAVIAGTASIVVQTLGPRYVQSALGVDPADAVYVFAPSAVGLVLALAAAPPLIRRRGERVVALAGFAMVTGALVLLGLVDSVAPAIHEINPLRVLEWFGVESQRLQAAALLAVPLGFGLSLTTTSVQTYINRRVPLAYQGRTFALQSSMKNAAAIGPLVGLGAAAGAFGVETVLVAAPFLLLAVAVGLVSLSSRFGGRAPGSGLEVVASFWAESDVPVSDPDRDGAPPSQRTEGEHDPEHQPA